MLFISEPYRQDKNLGKAYNDFMSMLPDDGVAILKDIDTCFVLPDTPYHLLEYHKLYPNALLTCFTNRLSPLAVPQLIGGKPSEDGNMKTWIELAQLKKKSLYGVTQIRQDISGFLMVLSKSFWKRFPFPENPYPDKGGCIGVDTAHNRQVREAGEKIYRCDGCFVYHGYRMFSNTTDKTHLMV